MSNETFIKIAIADDHKIFRDGIKMALSGKANLKMIWEAEDGKDMMHKIAIKKPEVLLMDIRMPEIDGINGIQLIRKEYEDIKIKINQSTAIGTNPDIARFILNKAVNIIVRQAFYIGFLVPVEREQHYIAI